MKLYRVHQKLKSNPIADVPAEVRRQLDASGIQIPKGGEIAITAGSRGIANIVAITRTVGDWIREQGATPFIAPCMGSHNGATAEGQRAMIESLGITEEAMGMEIRASMEVVKLGSVATGDVWMDKHCYESDGVLVLNRIKVHTCFSGPVQSGLMKMMVVGMGKIKSAKTFHTTPTDQMKDMIIEMGRVILDSGKILGGVGILEDGFDKTAEIHALRPDQIESREPELVLRNRDYMAWLPVDDLDVLIVSKIGKTYSGTGMDTNVIGYRGVKDYEDLDKPAIRIIGALELDPKSQGNAIGVGLADFITRRLRDAIDEDKTFINVYATGEMGRMKIPATLPTDEDLVRIIAERFGESRWMFIPNTLHLETLYVSGDLIDELKGDCEVDDQPIDIEFNDGDMALKF